MKALTRKEEDFHSRLDYFQQFSRKSFVNYLIEIANKAIWILPRFIRLTLECSNKTNVSILILFIDLDLASLLFLENFQIEKYFWENIDLKWFSIQHFRTTDESLKDYVIKFGELSDCLVMKDQNGHSKCFGFVTFTTSESLDEFMKNRPHLIDGRQVDPKRASSLLENLIEESLTGRGLFIFSAPWRSTKQWYSFNCEENLSRWTSWWLERRNSSKLFSTVR